jgi:general secretion pathway protein E
MANVAETAQRILVVDDDPGMCETLSDILEEKGYTVGVAQDGNQAVEEMKVTPYDLILIDVMMPGMNGVETLREIKAINPVATTVIMTGHSRLEGLVSEALWTGVDGVLYKPFEIDAVIQMIERKRHEQNEQPVIDLKRYQVDAEALRMIPEEMARKHTLVPLRLEGGYLVVAMADPNNLYAIEDLRARTSLSIRPLKASRGDIESALTLHYQNAIEIERQIERIAPTAGEAEIEAAQRLSAEVVAQTPIARAVELIVRQAVQDKASDIHIEPQVNQLRVRYRIDGVLHDAMSLPMRVHAPIISRIKVLSNLNIAERRRPQDGQFSVTVGGSSVDIRVATINTIYGEMAVLRVLDKSVSVKGLDELGFMPDMGEHYERVIHSPWGILLIAGPTGSGKTSTLYASINQLDKDENKIITIEDPVEYRFDGISQVQVNRQAGLSFASGLRAAMRLDPNIILVGEIRDQETASTAVQASLTGHLVLSSIHANDTVGAILRLVDLGVEPFLVTSSLLAVVSQRLVRRVCTHCRTLKPVPEIERLVYEREVGESRAEFYHGVGCNYCADTGYRGRVAVFELLILDDELRRLVLRSANTDEIRQAALTSGMRSMLCDGMLKVREGVTTPSEVLKNIFALS